MTLQLKAPSARTPPTPALSPPTILLQQELFWMPEVLSLALHLLTMTMEYPRLTQLEVGRFPLPSIPHLEFPNQAQLLTAMALPPLPPPPTLVLMH